MALSEEMRYALQKMIWDRLDGCLFPPRESDGHQVWREFLRRNNIVFEQNREARQHDGGHEVLVCSPLEYGVLKVPIELAKKILLLGELPS